jgi:hypothetical protein
MTLMCSLLPGRTGGKSPFVDAVPADTAADWNSRACRARQPTAFARLKIPL